MGHSRKNNVYLKKSVCCKNPNTVGIRQRQKIRSEIKRNYIRLAQSMREKNEPFIKNLTEKLHIYTISSDVPESLEVPESFEVPDSFKVPESSEVPENTNVNNTNNNSIRTNDNDNMECIKQKLVECFIQ